MRAGSASSVSANRRTSLADLAQADDEVAQLGGGRLELRGEPLERRQSVFGGRRERPGALALVGIDRRCGRMGAVAELRDVAEALALGTKRVLLPRLQPVRVLDQRLELVQPRALGVGAVLQLLDAPPGRDEAAPRLPGLLPPRPLRRPGERVEQVELVRRPREPPLRELAGEREQPVGRGDEVVACHAAAPRVGARAPVGANAPGDDEPRLVVRPAGRGAPRGRPRRRSPPARRAPPPRRPPSPPRRRAPRHLSTRAATRSPA